MSGPYQDIWWSDEAVFEAMVGHEHAETNDSTEQFRAALVAASKVQFKECDEPLYRVCPECGGYGFRSATGAKCECTLGFGIVKARMVPDSRLRYIADEWNAPHLKDGKAHAYDQVQAYWPSLAVLLGALTEDDDE